MTSEGMTSGATTRGVILVHGGAGAMRSMGGEREAAYREGLRAAACRGQLFEVLGGVESPEAVRLRLGKNPHRRPWQIRGPLFRRYQNGRRPVRYEAAVEPAKGLHHRIGR